MISVLHELRTAARSFRRYPVETLIASVAFAFGLGLAATLFAVARGAYLRGLPVPDTDRVMRIERLVPAGGTEPGGRFGEVKVEELASWQSRQRSFEGLIAWAYSNVTLRSPGAAAHRYTVAHITAGAFDLLRIRPALGRGLSTADETAVLLSDRVWREQFASDPGVVGREVLLGEESARIVGVMAPGMRFPLNQDLWTPLQSSRAAVRAWWVQVAGKLLPKTDSAAAATELTTLTRGVAASASRATVRVSPFVESYTRDIRRTVNLLLAAAALVLLLASANVSNLLRARSLARRQELAVRAVLGASRWQLAAQSMAEAALVALLGAVGGVVIAAAATQWLTHVTQGTLWMYWVDLRLDMSTVVFLALLGTLVAVLSAALPAAIALRRAPAEVLQQEGQRSGSRHAGRSARALVVVQVAGSAALLVGGALLLRTQHAASTFDQGDDPDRVLTAELFAPNVDSARLLTALPKFEAVLTADPDVLAVGEASSVPGSRSAMAKLEIEATGPFEGPTAEVRYGQVSPGLLGLIGASLRHGRGFTRGDSTAAPRVAIVNSSFAARYLSGEAVGRRIRVRDPREPEAWRTVVGVVSDTVLGLPEDGGLPGIYVPLAQDPPPRLYLVLRIRSASIGLAGRLPGILAAGDPEVPVTHVASLPEILTEAIRTRRLLGAAFMAFAGGALGLSLLGLYGVLAFSVRSTLRELGLRGALGASPRALFLFVFRRGSIDLLLGLAFGAALAWPLARMLASELYGVTPFDGLAWGAAFAVLALGGSISSALPAAGAARLDPATALRKP